MSMADLKSRLPDGEPLIEIGDIADMNEMLQVRYENTRRAQRAAERKARQK